MKKAISALIVDDDPLVANSNAEILAEAGYEIVGVAGDSEQALRCARELKPDIAILDIDLGPGRDGIETAAMIRAFSQTAILFVSGQLDTATKNRIAALPGAKFLQKPFWPESLLRAATETLAPRNPPPEEPAGGAKSRRRSSAASD